jgi:hypothetical protein
MTLDEKSLRKPGFALGTKVTLADGQGWMLPKPKLRFKPKIINGRVEISGGPFGSGFNHRAATWTADRSVNESERSVIPEMLEIPRVQIDHRNRRVAVL